ncbi:hypothetical protein EJ576_21750 [Pseudomonas sp. C 49-2]|uniref:hypothetical protein n=1 Tax=Pseudomonas sp. C 49-2 TaxID=2496849 RepID=UPI000F831DF1|nr:hypothetical protein [Pseudomonas sp. C 49-2]RTX96352.1 hypothetical protein EJ576_21750 [Pseudomonas sp. C 49-2]
MSKKNKKNKIAKTAVIDDIQVKTSLIKLKKIIDAKNFENLAFAQKPTEQGLSDTLSSIFICTILSINLTSFFSFQPYLGLIFIATFFPWCIFILYRGDSILSDSAKGFMSKLTNSLIISSVLFFILQAVFILFAYLPLNSGNENAIEKSEPYDSMMGSILNGDIFKLRFETYTYDEDTNIREYTLNITTPEKIKASGLCENPYRTTNEDEVCDAYEAYPQAMKLLDTYQYDPECLISLSKVDYIRFINCSKYSKAYIDPMKALIE